MHRIAFLTVVGGRTGPEGWPCVERIPSYRWAETTATAHPDDAGVLLGAVGAVRPGVANAVVSSCRTGTDPAPLAGIAPEDHVEAWLVDKDDANLGLAGQLVDAALVHCHPLLRRSAVRGQGAVRPTARLGHRRMSEVHGTLAGMTSRAHVLCRGTGHMPRQAPCGRR